jgi:hypothetical protein
MLARQARDKKDFIYKIQKKKQKAKKQVWIFGIARHRKQSSCPKVLLT